MTASFQRDSLPVIAICHGPTHFAAVTIAGEPVARGIETASLPPFESYVGFSDRKEIQFTHDVSRCASLTFDLTLREL